jgi:hypothetical protein
LNGEANSASKKHNSATIAHDVRRFGHENIRTEVFGTHSLDHVLIFGERHLRHVLKSYSVYYNETRTHLGLGKDSPLPRPIQRIGTIAATAVLSGLHHSYARMICGRGNHFSCGRPK